MLVFDADGALVNANRIAESLLGVRLDADAPLAPMPPEVRAVVERVRIHVLAGEGAYVPRGLRRRCWCPPRTARSPCCRGPLRCCGEEGGLIGATVVLQDVTRLRRFDELKNDLVATVAHEFRTPLTACAWPSTSAWRVPSVR